MSAITQNLGGIVEVARMLAHTGRLVADTPENTCAKAPPGLGKTLGDFLGYIKFVVLWGTIAAFVGGLGVMGLGRLFDHRVAARIGAITCVVAVVVAALYGTGYTIITSLSGSC